jgi:hypothetical protein
MTLNKTLGAAVAVALAVLAFASIASATTLEVKGVKQTGAVAIKATLKANTSLVLTETSGFAQRTCTASTLEGKTTTFTATTVSVPLTLLTFQTCTEGSFVVHVKGTLTFENIAGTTNATVRWAGMHLTMPSIFGVIGCTTAASPGTDVGILTGVSTGSALLDFKGVINCGFIPSTVWEASYVISGIEGLGVTS